MRRSDNLLAGACAVMLVACLGAIFLTRDTGGSDTPGKPAAAVSRPSVIDARTFDTARQMAALAETPEERELAREAARLADRELDQAFATALREAATFKPPADGPLQKLNARIAQAKKDIAAGKEQIAKLAASDESGVKLELAKAQLALHENELEDAQQDLALQGGDQHADLDRAFQEHEAAQREAQPPKPVAVIGTDTLGGQVQLWLALGNRNSQVLAAHQQAVKKVTALQWEHGVLKDMLDQKPPPTEAAASGAAPGNARVNAPGNDSELEAPAAILARLRGLSDQKKTLTELGRRMVDSQQLAAAYRNWSVVLEGRRRSVLHLLLRSLAVVLGILLAVVLLERAVRHAFSGEQKDRRRLYQQRFLAIVGLRLAAGVVILLLIFGTPNQTPTIIGLVTAGLTVVLKDFIMAFLGWFTLMGRNGVRVGDWVEIQGVGGEVIEVGILRTVLLEMGNWSTTGHPTGRRVSFMNGYAIEGHYFNFSTAGQWLWDQLEVTIPATGDPYGIAQQIRQVVERETEAESNLAQQDWERITRQYGTREFSPKPAVDLRPSGSGLEVHVRYITRGPQRYEVKSRLFREIVELLHKRAGTAAPV
jgi:small-conductance mechanosensitive channel